MALHDIDALAPKTFHRLLEAALSMAVVGKILARRPNLVGHEHLIVDAERGREVPEIHFGHAVKRRRVEYAPASLPETSDDLVKVAALLTGDNIEGQKSTESDGRNHFVGFWDSPCDQVGRRTSRLCMGGTG